MSCKTITGTKKSGESIKNRRKDLGLTIEEASKKAGVGVKSWCRYEAGESIRSDKAKGICKALNWQIFPEEFDDIESTFDLNEYKNHKAWSQSLCERFGEAVAIAFVIGSDVLLDYINDDLTMLSTMPRGSHIGQLNISMLGYDLPEQFFTRYDYEFLYQLKCTVLQLRKIANAGGSFIAHSVMQELALYLISEESELLIESMMDDMEAEGVSGLECLDDWMFDLFDDMDIITYLYSDYCVTEGETYHFDNWSKEQFYI